MKILAKGPGCCHGKNCPTVYRRESDGMLVVQGYLLSEKDRTELSLPNGEDAVVIPEDLIRELIKGAELS